MKALHFFEKGRKRGRFFTILLLTFPEKMALAAVGGFDRAIGAEGWVEGEALADKIKFEDRERYIFFDRRERLDFIVEQLQKKFGWKVEIKNNFSTPTFAELLAENHLAEDAGKLNLYINYNLPLRAQRQRKLRATYRAIKLVDYEKFWDECRGLSRQGYMKIEFWTPDVISVRGFFRSGFAWLQSYLNEYQGFSMGTNVLDAESYPTLLLRKFA